MQAVLLSLGFDRVTAVFNDTDLVQRSLTGDRQAFHQLTERLLSSRVRLLLANSTGPTSSKTSLKRRSSKPISHHRGQKPEHFSSWLSASLTTASANGCGESPSLCSRRTRRPTNRWLPEGDLIAESRSKNRLLKVLDQNLATSPPTRAQLI